MGKSLTYRDIEKHFNSSSNLFFLFGINIHRPFLNEYDQTHADASIFIIVICRSNSSDCISQGGSLPAEYKLEFSVDGVPYSDKHSKIHRLWHRTKLINYEFLYETYNSHSCYDKPENENGSIWKKFIMNMNSNQYENIYSKWVEFDVKISDAGVQFIEGQQLYNNTVVQQFTLYFFVTTFQCLQPPLIYFDGFISSKTYLSAFHFQLMSHKCDLHKYTCYLQMTEIRIDKSSLTNMTFYESDTINISISDPSVFSHRISYEQRIKPTNFIDRIYEKATIENNISLSDNEFYRNATCINKNLITSRQFLLCTQDYFKNQSVITTFRIDIILCKYSKTNANQCIFTLYRHVLDEYLRLFIPIKGDNITFVGFIRLSKDLPNNEWTSHITENYDKIYASHLTNRYDHMIEIKSNINSENSIIRYYQIITDQIHLCHLTCRNNCVQQSPNHTDYYISTSNIELILFCVKCNFNETYNKLNHSIIYFYTKLSRDIALFRIQIFNRLPPISFTCINDKNKRLVVKAKFHLINRINNSRTFSCSINPMIIYPYHDEIILECNNFSTRADIIIWAITELNHEEVRILLNPLYVTNEIFNSIIRMRINGIPHGDKIILEISSPLFGKLQHFELLTMNLTHKLIIKMNIALEWNYFSSVKNIFEEAFQLMNQYLKIYENDFYLLSNETNPRFYLVGLNQTSFLISIINYYRLILNYIDKELLYIKAIDFSQKIYSTVSII
ncbi:unnamed protein product [Rotaria sp. Silwood2]|nr:unnamed protein product [Rotaria sp. Silwood2]CAF4226141.1 unnamed protein product [Rotaria sp. Silwood2]